MSGGVLGVFYERITRIPALSLLGNALGVAGKAQPVSVVSPLTMEVVEGVHMLSVESSAPAAHASTHAAAGSDPVTLAQSQVTNLATDLAAKVGGSTGSTDNALLRADGTGGKTTQSSTATLADDGAIQSLSYTTLSPDGTRSLKLEAINGTHGGRLIAAGTGARVTLSVRDRDYVFNDGTGAGFQNPSDLVQSGNIRMPSASQVRWTGDSSPTSTPVLGIGRSANTVAEVNTGTAGVLGTMTALIRPSPYTFSTVPSASANTGSEIRITDRSNRFAYSDGTNWRFVADDVVIS